MADIANESTHTRLNVIRIGATNISLHLDGVTPNIVR